MTTTSSRPGATTLRDTAGGRPAETRASARADRPEADERLDELHHRRLHTRRHHEDDEDLADR